MVNVARHDKSEGLEILSIGKLYTGPWDKKYWSSSRGKDRHPYPVGYKSLRAQNGVTYTMEVLEGLKGPLFTISSSDGKTCSGNTPDIAWESFQKRGYTKLWHGKRFSCNLEGVEFFGFKNSLVQRLLRELVANVGGASEQNFLASDIRDGALETVDQLKCKAQISDYGLLYLEKTPVIRKRSNKSEGVNKKLVNSSKRHQQKCGMNVSDAHAVQIDQSTHGANTSTVKEELPVCCPGLSAPGSSADILENRNDATFDERVVQLGYLNQSIDPRIGENLQGECPISANTNVLTFDELIEAQEPTVRSLNTESPECSNLIAEQKNGVPNNHNCMSVVTDADGYAPDTLEDVDSSSIFSPKNKEQGHRDLKVTNSNELALCHSPANGSFSENEAAATICCTSSEAFDSDSVGLDITTSMMTVLLPRAVPLLKTFSRRKKKRKTSVPELAKVSDLRLENDKSRIQSSKSHEGTGVSTSIDSSNICVTNTCFDGILTNKCEAKDELRTYVRQEMKLNSKLESFLKFFDSYLHPMPILMVQLFNNEGDILIFVNCGYSDQLESTVFIYKATANGEMFGLPSLIGHAPIAFPQNVLGENVAVRRSSLLQLEPESRSLVLLNSIETPYCSVGKLHCKCTACASDCFKNSGIKIVKLNSGFVSPVLVLETRHSVSCFLVCGPSFLLAAEEGGKLNMWIMNPDWSQQKEISSLPTSGSMFPCIVELKRVPNSPVLVVGHNGLGNFSLWDINKRILVSTFSSSQALPVSECLPASFFICQRKPNCEMNMLQQEIMDATRKQRSCDGEYHNFSPEDDKDVGVWLLISTTSDPDSHCYYSGEHETGQARYFRLALLINNTVITGSAIDKGIAAVTSGGHGIIGRDDGLVYAWELSTGMKLGNLHSFKACSVSCVASNSGVLAIASGTRLLVYLTSS